MKYIIWYRRYSDLDHTMPIANLLIDKGINHEDIVFTDLYVDSSTRNILNDRVIKYLKSKKIKFSQNKLPSIVEKFKSLIIKINRYFFLKVINYFILKIFNYLPLIFYKVKINIYCIKYKGRAKFICDIGNLQIYRHLARKSKVNKIDLIALSHGSILHKGHKNKYFNDIIFKKEGYIHDYYDQILLTDKHTASYYSKKNRIKILGSLRYSKKWINKLDEIYKFTNIYSSKKKNKILLILDKKGENNINQFIPYYNPKQLHETINCICDNDDNELFIKLHPSSNKSFYPELFQNKLIDVNDNITTFELIKSSDIVLSMASTSVLDAIILKKRVAILTFVTNFRSIIPEFFEDMNIKSISELNKFIDSETSKNHNISEKKLELFYNTYISNFSESIEKKYFDLLV